MNTEVVLIVAQFYECMLNKNHNTKVKKIKQWGWCAERQTRTTFRYKSS